MVLVLCPHFAHSQQVDTIPARVRQVDTISAKTRKVDTIPLNINRSMSSMSVMKNKKHHPKQSIDIVKPVVVKPHSASKALLLSLLPGAGQVYNHQAWKIPIIYAALGAMGYFIYNNYSQMATFKEEYLFRVNNPGEVRLEGYETYPNASIYNLYQSYNQNFQLMIIITAGVYALNLVDAFVFGHLFDFQINDDLALSVRPSVMQSHQTITPVPSLGFSLRF